MQDGVAANVVFLLQLLYRWQWTRAPFARRDPPAEDGRQLPVGRLRRSMINCHKIKLGQCRCKPISAYICSDLICTHLIAMVEPPDQVPRLRKFRAEHPEWTIYPENNGWTWIAEHDGWTWIA